MCHMCQSKGDRYLKPGATVHCGEMWAVRSDESFDGSCGDVLSMQSSLHGVEQRIFDRDVRLKWLKGEMTILR